MINKNLLLYISMPIVNINLERFYRIEKENGILSYIMLLQKKFVFVFCAA